MSENSLLKPSGILITSHPDSDLCQIQDTVQCKHCGRHWIWIPGSGRRRGWCMNCNGFTCGSDLCDVCVPNEQLLENIEQGRRWDYRPIISSGGWEP